MGDSHVSKSYVINGEPVTPAENIPLPPEGMKNYTVRLNAEYSHNVTAADEASAITEAMETDTSDWDQVAWSEPEAEEEW